MTKLGKDSKSKFTMQFEEFVEFLRNDSKRQLNLKTEANMTYYKKLKYEINQFAMKFQGL